ncbi:MAG: hypothetical protein MUF64_18750 [Polyangiaceae bacterium]|nr:hypothetical protein [Polyangiaceae bacterium]
MKRERRLTKRERKALTGGGPQHQHNHEEAHIHCISCGRHLDHEEFEGVGTARWLRCDHGTEFPSCTACEASSRVLIEAHDRSGQPVKSAAAWH